MDRRDIQSVELRFFERTVMVGDDDAGPLVDHWDEEESRAQDGHQQEGPEKHSVQDLGDKLPVLHHLRGIKDAQVSRPH